MISRRSVFFVLMLTFVFSASAALAGDYGKKEMVGSWDFDIMAMIKAQFESQGQPMPPGVEEQMAGASMNISFTKEGRFTVNSVSPMGTNKEEGTFEIVKAEGKVLVVKTTSDAEQAQVQEFTLTFTDEDNFSAEMVQGGMTSTMQATRVKKDGKKAVKSEG